MAVAEKLLVFFIDLFLPILAGYLLKKQQRAGDSFFDKMMKLSIIVVTPVTVAISFWGTGISIEDIWLPFLGILMQMVPFGIGYLAVKKKYESPLEQGSYILAAMLMNRGVAGSLSVFILFGEQGYASAQLIMLLGNLVLYSFCFPMAQYFKEQNTKKNNFKFSIKKILFSPMQFPILGIIIGILLNFSGISRPAPFGDVMNISIHINAWLLLIPVGFSINFSEMKSYWKSTFDILFIKFILTPILLYLPARLLIDDDIILYAFLVLASSPTAINAVATAKLNKLNVHVAMSAFIMSTAVYVLVVFPAFLLINSLIL